MTVEIDEKQVPEIKDDDFNIKKDKPQSDDDFQVKIYQPQPYDEYALDCKLCKNYMALQHNIHTNVLLFQFYKCRCAYTDTHIIVRDKRLNEFLVHRSKGIQKQSAALIRGYILQTIIQVSNQYWLTNFLTNYTAIDAGLDLTIDEHMIAEYKFKRDDVKDDTDRYKSTESSSKMLVYLQQLAGSGDIIAIKHSIRYLESNAELAAFNIWLCRLQCDIYASMIAVLMSYMVDVYVHQIADNELDDYRRLIDMIKCMSVFIDDLCDKVIASEYEVPIDALAEARKLTAAAMLDKNMTYRQSRQLLNRIVDLYLAGVDAEHDSISILIGKLASIADECTLASNVMEFSHRELVDNIVYMMVLRLERSRDMARYAHNIQKNRSNQKELREYLKAR